MAENSPHRIALCITELDVGGAERFLVELATRLDRKQFEPAVFCLGPRPIGAGEALVARLARADVPVRFFDARGLRDAWRTVRQLRDALREQRPAVVQTFLWHANVLGPLAARKLFLEGDPTSRVPIVSGLRVAEPGRLWRRPLERWAGRWAARHVAVSEGVGRFARERIGLAAEKVLVIPNGVDVERFPAPAIDPESLGVRHGRRLLLFVGRLDKPDQKGASLLIEHAARLLEQLESHDLVMIGDGPAGAALRRCAAKLGVQDRVHWLGWRDDLPAILAAADLLIAPSRWEGMSNVVLEAMASRKPVVAFAAEGISELLSNDPQQVAARDDWPGLIDRVVEIVGDISPQQRLGEINRRRIESDFRLDPVVTAYERLYEHLIGGSHVLSARKS
jgi:starch synthase (maltosyl-transferring)